MVSDPIYGLLTFSLWLAMVFMALQRDPLFANLLRSSSISEYGIGIVILFRLSTAMVLGGILLKGSCRRS